MNDQNTNMFVAKAKGFGEFIRWTDLTEELLMRRLTEMMTTDDYQTEVDNIADLIMDQPLHPLERATWWLEYLLRHPGNVAMRNPVQHLAWYQYFLLDVLLVVAVGILVAVYCVITVVRRFLDWKKKTKKD